MEDPPEAIYPLVRGESWCIEVLSRDGLPAPIFLSVTIDDQMEPPTHQLVMARDALLRQVESMQNMIDKVDKD